MSIRTNYEKWYEEEGYYWGLEPGDFLDELIELCPPSPDKKVLDIGCGECGRRASCSRILPTGRWNG